MWIDYLSVDNAISKTGRIRTSKKFTETQLVNIIKATREFLEDSQASQVSQVKKAKREAEKSIGIELTWELFEATYQASALYDWAEEVFGSEFWTDFAPLIHSMYKSEWFEYCANYLSSIKDVEVLNKLRALYDLLTKNGKV